MESELYRSLACYDNRDETIVFDVELRNFPIERIRPLFEVGGDKEMYGSFKIGRYQQPEIRRLLPESIEFDWNEEKFSYFLECSDRAET